MVAELAHHLYQAGADIEKTTEYLVRAADQARVAAGHEESLACLDNARSLWEGDRSPRAADLLDRRAAALDSLGRRREAIAAGQEAAALWQELECYDRFAASIARVCVLLSWGMDMGAAVDESDRALTVLRAAPGPVRAPLLYLRAITLSVHGDVAEALETLAEANRASGPVHDPLARALALQYSSTINLAVMRMNVASQGYREARDVLTALGRPWEALDQAYVELQSAIHRGCLDEASALIDELQPSAERIGHRGMQLVFLMVRSLLRFLKGDLAGAEGDSAKAIEFARENRHPWGYLSELRRGEILFLRGRVDEALELMRRLASAEPPRAVT